MPIGIIAVLILAAIGASLSFLSGLIGFVPKSPTKCVEYSTDFDHMSTLYTLGNVEIREPKQKITTYP
jgi:hypothetical protein